MNESINEQQMKMRVSDIISSTNSINSISHPIINQLIEFGYNTLYAKRIFFYYHPQNIEDALNYLSLDNGIIQHHFFPDRNKSKDNICYLCGEVDNIHLNDVPNNNNNSEDLKTQNITKSSDLLETSENKIECPACCDLFYPNEKNTLKNCGHAFCEDCWEKFLCIKIEENKLTSIKCLDYECQEKPDDEFIMNYLNNNEILIKKYKKFKFELGIINDQNKKLCPFPNCDSYLELKDPNNKYVKCLNNHLFCFICLNKPHGKIACNKYINKSLNEYAEKNFLKKCPKCGIITEKYTGCNHITCSKCNYQWCWLCNKAYTEDHYEQGKCNGYQFFEPKNENEIQLLFDRKLNKIRQIRHHNNNINLNRSDYYDRYYEERYNNPYNNITFENIDDNILNYSEELFHPFESIIDDNNEEIVTLESINDYHNNYNYNYNRNLTLESISDYHNSYNKNNYYNYKSSFNKNIDETYEKKNIEISYFIDSNIKNSLNTYNNNSYKNKTNSNSLIDFNSDNSITYDNNDKYKINDNLNDFSFKSEKIENNNINNFNISKSFNNEIENKNIDNKNNNNNINKNNNIIINNDNQENNKNFNSINKNNNIISNLNNNNIFKNNINIKKENININNNIQYNNNYYKKDIVENIDVKINNNNINNFDKGNRSIKQTNFTVGIENNGPNSKNDFIPKNKINSNKKIINQNDNLNIFQKILIFFIYIFFGHIFFTINIYFMNWKNYFFLISLLLFETSFFFIQIIINILVIFIYIIKGRLNLFISQFYINIKIKCDKISEIHYITIYAYYIFSILFLGTYLGISFILYNYTKTKKVIYYIIAIITALITFPLHIIINPIILFYIVKNNKYNSKEILINITKFVNSLYEK